MTPATLGVLRWTAVAGQCLLVALCVAWAYFERPAPVVNVRWKEGLSEEARRKAERDLYLQFREDDTEGNYELGSPRPSDIAAVVAHAAVRDTSRIDREHATLTADSYSGTLRVWWAGPFKGAQGRVQFRILLAVIGLITLLCAWITNPNPRTFLRRVLGPWP